MVLVGSASCRQISTRAGDGVSMIDVRGTGRSYGHAATFRIQADTQGRFRSSIEGPIISEQGFDGEAGWIRQPSGEVNSSFLGELQSHRLLALIRAGLWREPSTGLTATPIAGSDGTRFEFRFGDGPVIGTGVLDQSTRDLAELDLTSSMATMKMRFSDYRDIDSRRIPYRVELDIGQGESEVSEVQQAQSQALPAEPPFSRPKDRPRTSTIDTSIRQPVPIRRAPTGHLLVQASIDSGPELWFILDSGAQGHTISAQYAASHPMDRVGEVAVATYFGIQMQPVWRARSLRLGPITLADPILNQIDTTELADVLGTEFAGIIGFEFFRQAIIEVDLAGNQLQVHHADSAELQSLHWYPLTVDNAHPLVQATIPQQSDGWYRLDLGAAGEPFGNVIFTSPARKRLNLGADRQLQHVDAGTYQFDIDRLDWIEVAGERFEQRSVAYSADQSGLFCDPFTVGNIGATLLSEHRVFLDYEQERFALLRK